MEAMILGRDFETVAVLDAFESFIWTDRYYEAGDCEVYAPASLDLIRTLVKGNYLWKKDTEHVMVITGVQLDTDAEVGVHLTAAGESLEAILKRRVIHQTTISGNLQNGIRKLLNENVISPSNSKRRIPNFVFIPSTDSRVTSITTEELQYQGENLYESIVELCMAYDLGFKVTLSDDYKFQFQLYMGEDRSYAQEANPWIVFSPEYDNFTSSTYVNSDAEFKNATYVAGAGEGSAQRFYEVEHSGAEGLDRMEMYTDASSVSDEYEVEVAVEDPDTGEVTYETQTMKYTDEEYFPMLAEEGELDLSEKQTTESYEGIIDASRQYTYGKDFFIGDIVQVVNEFGMESNSRISEIIWCHDLNGETMTPTFINI